MSEGSFQSLDLTAASVSLERLFDQVVRSIGRVRITRGDGSEDACILISHEELQGLEKALEILSSTDSVAQMRQEVLRIADALSLREPAVATSGAL